PPALLPQTPARPGKGVDGLPRRPSRDRPCRAAAGKTEKTLSETPQGHGRPFADEEKAGNALSETPQRPALLSQTPTVPRKGSQAALERGYGHRNVRRRSARRRRGTGTAPRAAAIRLEQQVAKALPGRVRGPEHRGEPA